MTDAILLDVDARGVATVTMNRPEIHNAFGPDLIDGLAGTFESLGRDAKVRAIVLKGAGKSFSAGADLKWMRRMADAGRAESMKDARALAEMLRTLDRVAKPTVALVQGAALGGGVGLASCCDVVIAAGNAVFALSEVRLGLVPATIAPYVVAAIGARHARRYFVTAERFDAEEAKRIGLAHLVVPASELDAAALRVLEPVLANGPKAMAGAKTLVRDVVGRAVDEQVIAETAELIATIRASDEGKEGVAAFLEKRKANWS